MYVDYARRVAYCVWNVFWHRAEHSTSGNHLLDGEKSILRFASAVLAYADASERRQRQSHLPSYHTKMPPLSRRRLVGIVSTSIYSRVREMRGGGWNRAPRSADPPSSCRVFSCMRNRHVICFQQLFGDCSLSTAHSVASKYGVAAVGGCERCRRCRRCPPPPTLPLSPALRVIEVLRLNEE